MNTLQTETAHLELEENPDPEDLLAVCRFCMTILREDGYADAASEIRELFD
jgi:hypothetical protein